MLSTLRNRASRRNVTPLYLLAVLLVSFALLMHALSPANASSIPDLKAKMKAIAASANGHTVETEVGTMLSSSTVVAYVQQLLQPGSNLTTYQTDLLQAIAASEPYVSLYPSVLSGTPLTSTQKQQLAIFMKTFNKNPAVQLILSQGTSLKHNSTALQADINTVVATDTGPYTVLSSTGDSTFDAFNQTVNGMLSPSMQALAGDVNGVLTDPNAEAYVASLPPEAVASFIPASQLIGLQLPATGTTLTSGCPPDTPVTRTELAEIMFVVGTFLVTSAVLAFIAEPAAIAAAGWLLVGTINSGVAFDQGILDMQHAMQGGDGGDNDTDPWGPYDLYPCYGDGWER